MIEWNGGKCPLPFGVAVKVRFRNGNEHVTKVGRKFAHVWFHSDPRHNQKFFPPSQDIVAYEVLEGK